MQLGLIGLGKMGWNLMENMLDHDVEVSVFDVNEETRKKAQNAEFDIEITNSLEKLVKSLPQPRIIWLMVPAGGPTNDSVSKLVDLMDQDDILIDGGNSYYKDSIDHGQTAAKKGIHFFDVGTSGGMSGARHDGNFMIGGEKDIFSQIKPLFEKIAAKNGYLYTGQCGSGHYLKMVHNGVEYGMMQAIGEGFEVLSKSQFNFDNEAVAKVWNNGSVVRSWLMKLAQEAFANDADLDKIKGVMHSSGEGAWTVEEAIKLHVPTPAISSALMMRYRSEENDTMTGKVVSSLRNGFGGHAVDKK